MKKKQRIQVANKVTFFDSSLLYLIFSFVILISLTVRLKVLGGYLHYNLNSILAQTYNVFTYYKMILLIILAVIVALLFLYRIYSYKIKIRKDYLLFCTLAIAVTAIISTYFNPLGISQIWGFYTRTNGLLTYLALFTLLYILSNLQIQEKNIMVLVHGVNLVSIIIVVIGIFQFFGIDIFNTAWYRAIYLPSQYSLSKVNSSLSQYSAVSILSNPNYYGAYCSIFFPLISAFAIKSKAWTSRVLFSIGSIALFIGVLTSISLGALLTTFISLLLLPIAFLNKGAAKVLAALYAAYSVIVLVMFLSFNIQTYKEVLKMVGAYLSNPKYLVLLGLAATIYIALLACRKCLIRHKRKILMVVIILCVVFAFVLHIYLLNNVVESHKDLFSNRGYAWHYTYQVLKDNFLIGYGPDNMYYAFPQDNPDAKVYAKNIVFDKPHNMYLQMAVDTGIFGLLAFICLLIIYLLMLIKSEELETNPAKKLFMLASILVVTAYMVQGIVNDNHLVIQPLLYTVMGVGMAMSQQKLNLLKNKK